MLNSYPSELAVVKRFWKYILDREVKMFASVAKTLRTNIFSERLASTFYFIIFLFQFMQGICGDMLWSSISNNLLISVATLLKDCAFNVKGKVSWLFPFLILNFAFDIITLIEKKLSVASFLG